MNLLGRICTVAVLATLAACAVPVKEATPIAADTPAEAEQIAAAGEPLAAASAYLQLAERSAEPELRADYTLRAAELFLSGGDPARAAEALQGAAAVPGDAQRELRHRLLAGEIELARQRPDDALLHLELPTAGAQLEQAALIRLHQLRSRAYALAGNHLEAASELLLLESLLLEPAEIEANQASILQILAELSEQSLSQMQVMAPEVMAGWLELARIAKTPSGAAEFQRAITEWRGRYPAHPALEGTIDALRARLSIEPLRPTRVALLLPDRGPFAEPAQAIRDGIFAAYYRDQSPARPVLRMYPLAADAANLPEVYGRAVADGAELIIGPLQKSAVNRLAGAPSLTVTTLALNRAELPDDAPLPPKLYQFGLPPEDEARQAAEKAWVDGHARALILVPQGLWGSRVATSFRQRWENLGGVVLEQQSYDGDKSDYSATIEQLLDLNESRARRDSLRNLLGGELKFEPRRRQDADVIFVGAFSRQARLIRPQLKFHRAADLPVVTTSHVFTGKIDRGSDQDMDGMEFPDAPWALQMERPTSTARAEISRLWPEGQERFGRLYAMGFDAYRLIPYLEWLQTYPTEYYDGETGQLHIDERGRIQRRLAWARFHGGRPQLLGYAPRLQEPAPRGDLAPAGPPPAPQPAADRQGG